MTEGTRAGVFITFEGGEGGGKSTQCRLLAEGLRAAGYEVVLTREPGGTPEAEEIRALLLSGAPEKWSPMAETLLFFAARTLHLERKIRPALAAGQIVICDRFVDSTRAYQGAAGGVSLDDIAALTRMVVGTTMPDLTFYLDIDPEVGLARAGRLGPADRFESRKLSFHRELRTAFQELALECSDRIEIVNAHLPADDLAYLIRQKVENRLAEQY